MHWGKKIFAISEMQALGKNTCNIWSLFLWKKLSKQIDNAMLIIILLFLQTIVSQSFAYIS